MTGSGRDIKAFEDLLVWQKARELTRHVFRITQQESLAHRYRFCEQFESAAVSVMNNIAEGFERNRRAEFAQFLTVAKGSCGEVRSMLYVALDAGYIDWLTFERLLALTSEVARMIAGLRITVNRQRRNERSQRPQSRSSKLEARS
jgi:four helix bundle protein